MHYRIRSTVNLQLTLLILFETALTTISILPQTAFMAYFKITDHIHRSVSRRSIENFIDVILKLVAYSECTMGFLIYLTILSKLRRRFFRRICPCIFPRRRRECLGNIDY